MPFSPQSPAATATRRRLRIALRIGALAAIVATAALPTAPATITLKDFRFAAPATVHPGLVRIVNAGHQLHFVDAIKVPHGMSATRVVRLLHEGHDAKVKLPSTGLLGLVPPGTVNLATVDLAPGSYVLACLYGSAGSHGKEHTMLGMERTIHVR